MFNAAILFLSVLVFSSCQNLGVKTADRNTGSGKVSSQDISEGSGDGKSVTSQEISDDSDVTDTAMTVVQNRTGEGGVLIAYEILGNRKMVPSGGCRLKLQNMTTSKTYFVSIKANQANVFRELPPGRYFGPRFSCRTTKVWNLDALFAEGFGVESGKVSYVGKIIFEFDEKDLADFRHASRAESRAAFETAKVTFADDPKFISGFTTRPMEDDMVNADQLEAFDVYAKGTNDPQGTLDTLMKKLNVCSRQGQKKDPLRYGDLKYIATYKEKKITNLDKQDDAHALSTDFINCVENSLRSYSPPIATNLEVQVRF